MDVCLPFQSLCPVSLFGVYDTPTSRPYFRWSARSPPPPSFTPSLAKSQPQTTLEPISELFKSLTTMRPSTPNLGTSAPGRAPAISLQQQTLLAISFLGLVASVSFFGMRMLTVPNDGLCTELGYPGCKLSPPPLPILDRYDLRNHQPHTPACMQWRDEEILTKVTVKTSLLAVANQAARYRWLNFDEYYERSETYRGPPTPQREAAWESLLPCNVHHDSKHRSTHAGGLTLDGNQMASASSKPAPSPPSPPTTKTLRFRVQSYTWAAW